MFSFPFFSWLHCLAIELYITFILIGWLMKVNVSSILLDGEIMNKVKIRNHIIISNIGKVDSNPTMVNSKNSNNYVI